MLYVQFSGGAEPSLSSESKGAGRTLMLLTKE